MGRGFRTLQARPNATSLIKPVSLIEVTPLTLVDRRICNLLLENAWDAFDKPVTHVELSWWPKTKPVGVDLALLAFFRTYAENHPIS